MTAPTRDDQAGRGDWRITLGKRLIVDFSVFKPQFSRRLSRIFFSASPRPSRNFRGRLAGLAQIGAGGRLSRRLRGLVLVRLNVISVQMTQHRGGSRPKEGTNLRRLTMKAALMILVSRT